MPLIGIEIEGLGTIKLGEEKVEIETLLGLPETAFDKQSFYDNYEFRIDYDKFNKVEFIEFIYGPYPEKSELTIFNINPFSIGTQNLIDLLTKENNGEIDDSEAEYCYGRRKKNFEFLKLKSAYLSNYGRQN